jgi:hypothetical protein
MSFSLDTGVCGPGTAVKISNADVFPTSFSYTKDTMDSFGTESWSLTQFLGTGIGGITALKPPSHILKGIAMGTKVGDLSGINMPESLVQATQGSVQAGQMGKADSVDHGVVVGVGGGSNANTYMGQGSAQMPYMVLYLQ